MWVAHSLLSPPVQVWNGGCVCGDDVGFLFSAADPKRRKNALFSWSCPGKSTLCLAASDGEGEEQQHSPGQCLTLRAVTVPGCNFSFYQCCWILGMEDLSTNSGWILYKSTAKKCFDSKQIPQTSANRTVSLIFLERHEGWSTDGKVANLLGEGNSSLWGSMWLWGTSGRSVVALPWILEVWGQRCKVRPLLQKVRQNT